VNPPNPFDVQAPPFKQGLGIQASPNKINKFIEQNKIIRLLKLIYKFHRNKTVGEKEKSMILSRYTYLFRIEVHYNLMDIYIDIHHFH
jgi:hypothetical protein